MFQARFFAFVMVLWLGPLAAFAAPNKELEEALALVSRSKFEEARPMLVSLLYTGDLGKKEMVAARTALAKCYFYTGQVELSRKEVVALLKKQPKLKLDAKRTSPDFVAFFEEVRESIKGRGKTKDPDPPATKPAEVTTQIVEKSVVVVVNKDQPASQPSSTVVSPAVTAAPDDALAPRVIAEAKPAYQPGPLWIRWMPAGIGQFSNKDYVGGAVFLSLTVALAAANVVLAVLAETRVDRATNQYAAGTPFGLYVAQQATAAAAYAALIAGTVDALAFSPARGRAAFEAKNR